MEAPSRGEPGATCQQGRLLGNQVRGFPTWKCQRQVGPAPAPGTPLARARLPRRPHVAVGHPPRPPREASTTAATPPATCVDSTCGSCRSWRCTCSKHSRFPTNQQPHKKHTRIGAPAAAPWVKNPTSIHEDSVQSLASLSGLRIRCCRELWCRSQTRLRFHATLAVVQAGSCRSNWTPSLGTSVCHGYGPKKKKEKKNIRDTLASCLKEKPYSGTLNTHDWNKKM